MTPEATISFNTGRRGKLGEPYRQVHIHKDWTLGEKLDSLCEAFGADKMRALDLLSDVEEYLIEGLSDGLVQKARATRRQYYDGYFESELVRLGFSLNHAQSLVREVVYALERVDSDSFDRIKLFSKLRQKIK